MGQKKNERGEMKGMERDRRDGMKVLGGTN